MGKLERCLKCFERYEKQPNDETIADVVMALMQIAPELQLLQEKSIKFETRMNAQKFGWMVVEKAD